MEAFSSREDAIMMRMMREGTWGTEQAFQVFPLLRLELWQDICQEFLPTTDFPQEN